MKRETDWTILSDTVRVEQRERQVEEMFERKQFRPLGQSWALVFSVGLVQCLRNLIDHSGMHS